MSYGIKKQVWAGPIEVSPETSIATGRYLDKLEYRKTDKSEFLIVGVRDKAGKTASKIYFAPKIGGFIKTEEDLSKEQTRFSRILQNLTRSLLGEEYETGAVSSFEMFCKKVIADIPTSLYNKELRIKVILDKNNRATLPTGSPIFEDPIRVSPEDSKLKVYPKEKVVKSEVVMDEDPDEKSVKKTEVDDFDDLPFK